MQHGQLISHVDTDIVSREQLAVVPAPLATQTFRPVPHIELVEALDTALDRSGIRIREEQFALRRDGSVLFGVLQLAYGERPDSIAALGLRTANDRSMSIQICAGLSVFVCDNLVFRGDLIALRRKHTAGLDLEDELALAVTRFQDHYGCLAREVDALKAETLLDIAAKAVIHDVFAAGILPVRLFPAVSNAYFEPQIPEFEPRTVWSLHNAFTSAAKVMPISTRLEALRGVGKLFGMSSGPNAA